MEQIDLNNTLQKGRLIFKKKFGMVLNIFSFSSLIAFIELVCSLIVTKQNIFENVIAWLIIIPSSILISILKWKFTMRIIRLKTDKSKSENRQIIEQFINKKGFQYKYHNNDFIQTVSKSGILWLRMDLTFLIRNNEIFINLNYYDAHANWPSVFRLTKYIDEIKNASAQHAVYPIRVSVVCEVHHPHQFFVSVDNDSLRKPPLLICQTLGARLRNAR